MKFLKHLFPVKQSKKLGNFSRSSTASNAVAKPKSFGEKRAQRMNNSLAKAMKERKELVRKEFASPNPLNNVYKQKGNRLDVRIRKFKDGSK